MSTTNKSPPPTPSVSFQDQHVEYQTSHHHASPPSIASSSGPSTSSRSAGLSKPTFATSISQYDGNTSFVNALYTDDNGDQIDGCLTPEPDAANQQPKFRRGWAASTTNSRAIENPLQASTRSNESMLSKYRNQYSGRGQVKKTAKWKEEHPNRPSAARWKQQNMPAWQPVYRPLNVIGTFLGFGVLLVALGVLMLISNTKTIEVFHDYTDCPSIEFPGKTCAEVVENKLPAPAPPTCKCLVTLPIPTAISAPVYLYYGLEGFYQNHRRYVSSVDHSQLLGHAVDANSISSNCGPYTTDSRGKVYAPCGAIANSLFTDTFKLKYGSSVLAIKETDIAWLTDKQKKFHNPSSWADTVKPKYWLKPANELDPENPENNGYQNEHLIVWMRTAAFPHFRKLWGRIDTDSLWSDKALRPGNYTIEIGYNYPTVLKNSTHGHLRIPKLLLISNTSWIGGRNLFLPILYIVVGGFCIVFGAFFAVLIWRVKKRSDKRIRPQNAPNYQTMTSTEAAATAGPFSAPMGEAPSPILDDEDSTTP